jgi:hypothetical protein
MIFHISRRFKSGSALLTFIGLLASVLSYMSNKVLPVGKELSTSLVVARVLKPEMLRLVVIFQSKVPAKCFPTVWIVTLVF